MDGGHVSDSLALIGWADKMSNADSTRIGMWGFSHGGFVTLGALKATERLRAAAIVGAPTDLVNTKRRAEFDEFEYPHVIKDYSQDNEGDWLGSRPSDGRGSSRREPLPSFFMTELTRASSPRIPYLSRVSCSVSSAPIA